MIVSINSYFHCALSFDDQMINIYLMELQDISGYQIYIPDSGITFEAYSVDSHALVSK